MTGILTAIPWEPDMINAVMGLRFGEEPWECEIDQWIKEDVNWTIEKFRTEVWLFVNDSRELVGFGSLGITRWEWPEPRGERTAISLIPALGIDIHFRGEPRMEDVPRYSTQIMDHLISEATKRTDRAPALGLFVHPDNHRARAVYERAGFRPWPQTSRGWEDVQYPGMILRLRPERLP